MGLLRRRAASVGLAVLGVLAATFGACSGTHHPRAGRVTPTTTSPKSSTTTLHRGSTGPTGPTGFTGPTGASGAGGAPGPPGGTGEETVPPATSAPTTTGATASPWPPGALLGLRDLTVTIAFADAQVTQG